MLPGATHILLSGLAGGDDYSPTDEAYAWSMWGRTHLSELRDFATAYQWLHPVGSSGYEQARRVAALTATSSGAEFRAALGWIQGLPATTALRDAQRRIVESTDEVIRYRMEATSARARAPSSAGGDLPSIVVGKEVSAAWGDGIGVPVPSPATAWITEHVPFTRWLEPGEFDLNVLETIAEVAKFMGMIVGIGAAVWLFDKTWPR